MYGIIKKQKTVSLSSTEAEYTTLVEKLTTATWFWCVMKELDVEQSTPSTEYDSNGAIKRDGQRSLQEGYVTQTYRHQVELHKREFL